MRKLYHKKFGRSTLQSIMIKLANLNLFGIGGIQENINKY